MSEKFLKHMGLEEHEHTDWARALAELASEGARINLLALNGLGPEERAQLGSSPQQVEQTWLDGAKRAFQLVLYKDGWSKQEAKLLLRLDELTNNPAHIIEADGHKWVSIRALCRTQTDRHTARRLVLRGTWEMRTVGKIHAFRQVRLVFLPCENKNKKVRI